MLESINYIFLRKYLLHVWQRNNI